MRLLTVTIFVILLPSVSLFAADSATWGVRLGTAFSSPEYEMTGERFEFDSHFATGLSVGLTVEFPLAAFITGRGEVVYTEKAGRCDVTDSEGLGTRELESNIGFLSLSPQVKLAIPTMRAGPYLLVGPRMDIRITDDVEWLSLTDGDLEPVVWSLTVGLGRQFELGKTAVVLEIVYQHDLTDIVESSSLSLKHRTFVVHAGLVL